MYPELFNIGPIAVRSYGVMLAISFFAALYYVYRIAARQKIDFGLLVLVAYVFIFGALVGARLSYVLFHLGEFQHNWLAVINPFHPGQFGISGLNFFGGILGAILFSYIYLKIRRLSVLETYDIYAPTVALGLFFTRIGCFLNGCCFGKETTLPWGVCYPDGSIPHYIFGSVPLHPTQLYTSLYGLLLFFILHHRLINRSFPGQIVALLLIYEAVFRFIIEFFRYYEEEMFFSFFGIHPTYNQIMAMALLLFGLGIYIVQYQVHKAGLMMEIDS